MVSFPTSLDSLTNPASSDQLASVSVPHATQHANANDILEALEAKLGTGSSTPASAGQPLVGTASGASAWGLTAVSGTPIAHGLYRENVVKGWLEADAAGNITGQFNVASITDTGTGYLTITWDRDFSGTNYVVVANAQADPGGTAATTLVAQVLTTNKTAGSTEIKVLRVSDGATSDPTRYLVLAIGGQ